MSSALFRLMLDSADRYPDDISLLCGAQCLTYSELAAETQTAAAFLQRLGVMQTDRVAIWLDNRTETVVFVLAASMIGAIAVPMNAALRGRQVGHILNDSTSKLLVTTTRAYESAVSDLYECAALQAVVLVDSMQPDDTQQTSAFAINRWPIESDGDLPVIVKPRFGPRDHPAAIFYTSGSTGSPKGVTISNTNLTDGARIVSGYLGNLPTDRIMAVLPLSFDYGFSQISTALFTGAAAVLANYYLPKALLNEAAEKEITALAGVPTMWSQLVTVDWPSSLKTSLRYVTNSGGRLSLAIIDKLKTRLPDSKIFLMYGLTESFRSTYLDPKHVFDRPTSIGKAIPEVTVTIRRQDGSICEPREHGELVHEGALVSLGYWDNTKETESRFRRTSSDVNGDVETKAVWSGDIAYADELGYFYFVERSDEMIKSKGYRISPSEIEDVVQSCSESIHAAAFGVDDESIGQKVVVAVSPKLSDADIERIRRVCAKELPYFMQPAVIFSISDLPLTSNRKVDRTALRRILQVDLAAP